MRPLALIWLGLLAGCASTPPIDRMAEAQALSQEFRITEDRIKLTSRCDYAIAPKGVPQADSLQGVCFITDDGLHVRVIDVTTGKTEKTLSFKRAELESISRVPHALYEQLQVRLPNHIIAFYMRPDGGFGLNWEASNKFVELIKSMGVPQIEATARIGFVAPGGGRGAVIPIFIPRGR